MIFSAPYPIVSGSPNVPWAAFLIAAVTLYDYASIDPNLRNKNTPDQEIAHEYDFIVVGAGSAGSVVASRLSEVENWKVLLLEAGPIDETILSETPFLFMSLWDTDFDWQFKTEPSKTACLSSPDARCMWPRGKLLGGTSSFNGMVYIRGNSRDYDHWESLGNPGWGWNDVLPYFKKSEGIRIPELENSPYHSTTGPLTVSHAKYRSPLGPAFLQAWEELGYPIQDINGASQVGFFRAQWTVRDGHRCSAAKAFLRPARGRPNLDIAMGSFVTKILINPTTKVAYGVEFYRNGTFHRVKARKEVIVSAGALQSPPLLMLSGIGPKNDLQKLSIPVLSDLKVGYNLQDHMKMQRLLFLINKPVISCDPRLNLNNAVDDYAKSGVGVLTVPNHEAIGNIFTSYTNKSSGWPDVQLVIYPTLTVGNFTQGANQAKSLPESRDAGADSYSNPPGCQNMQDSWAMNVAVLRPKSRGRIKLRSKNPFEYPVFIHNAFTKRQDVLTIVEGIQRAIRMANTSAMQQFGSRLNYTNPNCTHETLYSDAFWECAIKYDAETVWHQCGTCKMGPQTDPDAVVDPQLRVYGVKRLRVIDASIMPYLISGNTNAPTIMIAEKGSDLIKAAWRTGSGCRPYRK